MWKLLLLPVCISFVVGAPETRFLITPKLYSTLQNKGAANVFISLKANTRTILETITNGRLETRIEKLNALHDALEDLAEKTQRPILDFLSNRQHPQSFIVISFWITNQIFIKNADASLVHDIALQFSDIVSSIDEEVFAHLIEPVSIQTNATLNNQEVQWGVQKIQAPEAWEHLEGVAIVKGGESVVVANIDTGVRATHEALRHNFVGDYGWFDPSTGTPHPTDYNGHGTHTMGTITGGNGIGVAPKARWAACRGCAGVFCAQSHLVACGQFFACPTLANGSKPDCSHAPHLISNSWGGGRGETWYSGVIEAWHAVGIIPIFSIGNSGPICSTPSSPGDHKDVIAVGSTMGNDAISTFSSAGPTLDGRIKPEVTAPGSDIVSAYHTADDAYAAISGTSMACPHAAGVIALLFTRNSELSYEEAKHLLLQNTDQSLRFSRRVCNGISDDIFPNNVFGSGRINALKSIATQSRTILKNAL